MRTSSVLLLSCLLCTTPVVASAAPSQDVVAAMSLYKEGRALAQQEKWAEALEKFQASQRLNPTLKAHYEIANCFEQLGRTASAWSHFLLLADESWVAGQKERARYSKKQAERLEPKLVRLTIRVKTQAPELKVMRGDALVSAAEFGTAVPVDPGRIKVTASAPGYREFSAEINVGGDTPKAEVVIPELEALPAGPQPAPPVAPKDAGAEPEGEVTSAPAAPHDQGSSWGTQRVIGAGVFGVGVVSALVGGYFGLRAIQLNQDAKDATDQSRRDELNDDRFAKGDLSTGFFIAAGVLAVGGGVLYLTAPDAAQQAAVEVSPYQARLLWGARW
ncbi:MAG: tetratricopeptide repeat protein [Polyangiaceae bacterium]